MADNPEPEPAPKGVDLTRPNTARIYDWYLGGDANWAIDRELGAQTVQLSPTVRTVARANRDFLRRAVEFCVRNGVRQFLDIGSGVPTAGNVHEVADGLDEESRCVYVDNEAVAVAHAQVLLDENGEPDRHAVINADLREADDLWAKAMATGVLDPDEPIALLLVAVMHFVPPELGAEQALARYRALLPSGSLVVISHLTADGADERRKADLAAARDLYSKSSSPLCARSHEEVAALFGDLELVDPGVVWLQDWHPDAQMPPSVLFTERPQDCGVLGAVARKR